jgi:hypothetical protein
MYMEAYSAPATATEMKNTTDSLVKLHGLAAPDNATQVNMNINGTKQLERMSDEDLLRIAGKELDYLEHTETPKFLLTSREPLNLRDEHCYFLEPLRSISAVSKNKHPFSTFRIVSSSLGVARNPLYPPFPSRAGLFGLRNSAICL